MGLEYEELTDPISLKMIANCQGYMPAAEIRLKETGLAVPKEYLTYAESIRDFEVREDDTWVISFPKCGTTWTQEMVWLLKNNFDFDTAKKEFIFIRFPFFDLKFLSGDEEEVPETISLISQLPSPRFIKTHLPAELLPEQIWTKKPKIIYVARDPKDAVISYFHHFTLLNNYKGTQDEFVEAFLQDKVVSSPYWFNVLGYWKLRDESNILFITYEDMKKDLRKIVQQVACFLNVKITEEQEAKLLDHLTFENMKNNSAVNYEVVLRNTDTLGTKFIRQGKSGGWKQALNDEQIEEFEKWTKKWLEGTDCHLYKNTI